MSYFQDASPESLGISSGGILRFLDRMEEKNIELHSFMAVSYTHLTLPTKRIV